MKREDLKNQLINAGVADDKLNNLLDYIMAANGADINQYKNDLEASKTKYADDIKAKDDLIKSHEEKLKGYKDYDELKKFKEDTLFNAEKSKRIDFLKAQGCKHPDLILGQLDFEKATYDEDKKTYTGLDESLKNLKKNYGDLFVEQKTQQIDPNTTPKSNGSDFFEEYKRNNPDLKGL